MTDATTDPADLTADAAPEPTAAQARLAAQREALAELGEHVAMRRPDCVSGHEVTVHDDQAELTVDVKLASLPGLVEFLRGDDETRFSTLVDITAVDYPGRKKRFTVVYHFLSMYRNHRIRLRAQARASDMVPSITGIHPSANWFEREIFDMFGLLFSGHPDLRRILTDYGFRGHPLRKDFPTTGYTEVRYDEVLKRVVYEPVNLVQEYRQFDFMSPWEGADYVLPGDEKGDGK
ncbi:MAG: NADH-quinone oxidoreductase subunit C [Paracoccaceae bacterium]